MIGAKRARADAVPVVAGARAAVPLQQWINTPQQDRSKKTLERLLDATEQIIRTKGASAVTVPSVARAARSSVGSFYARFPDKASLLRTLHERACDQSVATAAAALIPARWKGVPTEAVVRSFIGFAVQLFAQRRPMMLAFSSELGGDAAFAARRAHTAAEIARCFHALFAEREEAIGHPTPMLAVDMSLRFVTATLEQRNALESTGNPDVTVDDDTLVAELTRAVLRYLDVA